MAEKIGKPCDCIYTYEKHYLTMVLGERIDSEKEERAKMEERLEDASPEEKKLFGDNPLIGYDMLIRDLDVVLERVGGMPECD